MDHDDLDYLEGVSVDFLFEGVKPEINDLLALSGSSDTNRMIESRMGFDQFKEYKFCQIDDYWGIWSESRHGDEVMIWLFPLIDGEIMDHHSGPYDGLRMSFRVLGNPIERADEFIQVVEHFSRALPVKVQYRMATQAIESLKGDIRAIAEYWKDQGIEVGSARAHSVGV